jgi:hypothetical protein
MTDRARPRRLHRRLTAALYALRQIFASGWSVPDVAASFTAPDTLARLAAVAKSGANRATTVELYRLIGAIRAKGADVGHVEAPVGGVSGAVAAFARAADVGDVRDALVRIASGAVHFALANPFLAAVRALSRRSSSRRRQSSASSGCSQRPPTRTGSPGSSSS